MDKHLIFEIENVLTPEICKEIISKFEESPNKRQSVITNPMDGTTITDLKRRNSLELFVTGRKGWEHIDKILNKSLQKALDLYMTEVEKQIEVVYDQPHFLSAMMLRAGELSDNGYCLIRVNQNSEYVWHHDDNYNKTILKCIWYLDDRDEKDGGNTMFLNGRVIKPKAGKVVLFPTTWIHAHCGTKVMNKNKYIIITEISARS